jgi:hypothetical protein
MPYSVLRGEKIWLCSHHLPENLGERDAIFETEKTAVYLDAWLVTILLNIIFVSSPRSKAAATRPALRRQ